jgi:hypothetical protein
MVEHARHNACQFFGCAGFQGSLSHTCNNIGEAGTGHKTVVQISSGVVGTGWEDWSAEPLYIRSRDAVHRAATRYATFAFNQNSIIPCLGWYSDVNLIVAHFHSLPKLTSLSSCLLSTFAVARSKSSCVTCTLLSRRAYIPASVQTPLSSAPEQPFIFSAILVRLMPRVKFMEREWIRRMSARASTLGRL